MKPRIGDFVVAALCFILAAAIWIYPFLGKESGKNVVIEYNGKEKSIPLGNTGIYTFGGCEVCFEKDGVYVKKSDCPDGVCVRTGKISRAGQSIICVPNRVSIKICGSGDWDAISG